MILVGKKPHIVSTDTNFETIKNGDSEYVMGFALKKAKIDCSEERIPDEVNQSFFDICSTSNSSISEINNIESEKNAVLYIAGFLAKKFSDKFPDLGTYTFTTEKNNSDHTYYFAKPSWTENLSFEGLPEPSDVWAAAVTKMEKYFNQYHGTTLKTAEKVVSQTINYIFKNCQEIDKTLVDEFVKQRIFFRMKYLNSFLKSEIRFGKRKVENEETQKMFKQLRKSIT